MIARQIAEMVENGHRDRIEVWASGPDDDNAFWNDTRSNRSVEESGDAGDRSASGGRAVILVTLGGGGDSVDVLAAGSSQAVTLHDGGLPRPLVDDLRGVLRVAMRDWVRRGIDLAYWSSYPKVGDRPTETTASPGGLIREMGFGSLAEMHYRSGAVTPVVGSQRWRQIGAMPVRIESVSVARPDDWQRCRDRLSGITERTYIDSLDCKSIKPHRSALQTLEGYRRSDSFEPQFWKVIVDRQSGVDCGIVIGSHHRGHDPPAGELVYLGLAPTFRGRGWSRIILSDIAAQMSGAGCQTFWVAHDSANLPAASLYQSLDLSLVHRQRMWFRTLS